METISNEQTVSILESKLQEMLSEYHKVDKEQKEREVVINSIKTTILAITNPSSMSLVSKTNGLPVLEQKVFTYAPESSWKERIIAFMKFKNKAVTTADVVDGIAEIEKGFTKTQILNLVSGNMSDLVKHGHVKTYKPKKMKGAYYASPLWFDETGVELKEEHKPEIKEVTIW